MDHPVVAADEEVEKVIRQLPRTKLEEILSCASGFGVGVGVRLKLKVRLKLGFGLRLGFGSSSGSGLGSFRLDSGSGLQY